jgi:predicted lysophospholipase L1 biosynthesis ABC-type transport system permease subunit
MTKRQRLQLLLVMLFPALFAVTLFHQPADLLAAITAIAVVLLLVAGPLAPQTLPAWTRSLSLRTKALRTAFLRLRDPDAAGRPRPRAPGLGVLAA